MSEFKQAKVAPTVPELVDPLLIDLPMPIRTPRLLIRPWRSGDGQQLLDVKRESWAELGRWLSWVSGPVEALTERAEEALVRRRTAEYILRTEIHLPVFDHAGRLLGVSGFHAVDWHGRLFSVGYWIRTSETGRGLATEALNALTRYAFGALAANRVAVSHVVENERSRRVIERCGFVLEGTTHNFYVLNGGLIDSHHYARFDCDRLPDLDVTWG